MTRAMPAKIQEQISYHYPGDRFVKRNKYSAKSCTCLNRAHARHGSILEADQCNVLYLSRVPYVTQFKIACYVEGQLVCNHYVDFAIFKNWKHAEVGMFPVKFIETKGYETDVWKIKKRLVDALFPNIPYEVLREKPGFYRPRKAR